MSSGESGRGLGRLSDGDVGGGGGETMPAEVGEERHHSGESPSGALRSPVVWNREVSMLRGGSGSEYP